MSEGARRLEDVACPFCGLLCDDVAVAASAHGVAVTANGCERSKALFAAAIMGTTNALVGGNAASLDEAIAHAAALLRKARSPRIVSAGADVAAARSMVALAEHCGGRVAHEDDAVLARNQRVLRTSGWTATTLTEVRNRADLLVVAGEDVGLRFPRFYERCFGEFDTLFETGPRELWFLGPVPQGLPAAIRMRSSSLPVEAPQLAEAFSAMRALHAGRRLDARSAGGVDVARLGALLERMRAARYGVLAWSAAGLTFPHADLAVQAMCTLVGALNETGRFSVLPLAGSDGALSLQQVVTWQTGMPAPVDFGAGPPAPEVGRPADALVFLSALDPARTVPAAGVSTVVLGHPGMRVPACEVFIPVGVPGVHHDGHFHRADSVVAVPVRRLAGNALPSAAAVLDRILRRLREPA